MSNASFPNRVIYFLRPLTKPEGRTMNYRPGVGLGATV
jgi:hypothetical protein